MKEVLDELFLGWLCCAVCRRWYGCDVTSEFPLSHLGMRGFFSAGATVLRNRSLRGLASGAGWEGSLIFGPRHCFRGVEFGWRRANLVEYPDCS